VTFLTFTLCTEARVIKRIKTDDVTVVGVTSVGDEMFALQQRYRDKVVVYSTDDYRLLRRLNVPDYNPDEYCDMTSCVRRKCLYMSDNRKRCIHRYALASNDTSNWPLCFCPVGLSVTANGNLLIACNTPKQLVELSAESGKQVREISLQEDIEHLWHGVQLTNGQFVVCHGVYGSLNRVCMIDDDGRVTGSYGREVGSGDGQLRCPSHLAVDEDSQLIFVADDVNARVVVLSPTLQFVRYISEGMYRPKRLHLDQTTRRMYVAQYNLDVTVTQL